MSVRPPVVLAALVLAPLLASLHGTHGPATVRLNLGPGDAPYVRGFLPDYEIENEQGLHWSRPEAQVVLPLLLSGPGEVALRFGPPPGGAVRIAVALDGVPIGEFECCRHRALQSRRVPFASPAKTAGRVSLRVTGGDEKDLGLFLDRVDLELGEGAQLGLAGGARWRAPVTVALVLLVLWTAGFALPAAAWAGAPLSAALTFALLRDPWLVHRLLERLPEALLVLFLPAALLLRRWPGVEGEARRAALALAVAAFLVRGAALNHPSFFYPDYLVHARLMAVARDAGGGLWRSPYAILYTPRPGPAPKDTLTRATSGLWLRRAGELDLGLPYSLLPHALLAPWARGQDASIALLKTAGAAASAAAVAVLAFLAARLSLSPWWAALLVCAPPPLVELSLGAVPAAFGHAAELALLLYWASHAERAAAARVVALGALGLALVQLVYSAALLTAPVFVLLLSAARGLKHPMVGRGLALSALGGTLLSTALYYRDFLPAAFGLLRQMSSGGALSPATSGPALFETGLNRVDSSFLPFALVLVVPAAIGLFRPTARPGGEWVLAFGATVGLFALGRVVVPGVLGAVHLTLLATPLLVLWAGDGLGRGLARGGAPRIAAAAVALTGALLGLGLQLQQILARAGHAR